MTYSASLAKLAAAGFVLDSVTEAGEVFAWALPSGRIAKRLRLLADGSVRTA